METSISRSLLLIPPQGSDIPTGKDVGIFFPEADMNHKDKKNSILTDIRKKVIPLVFAPFINNIAVEGHKAGIKLLDRNYAYDDTFQDALRRADRVRFYQMDFPHRGRLECERPFLLAHSFMAQDNLPLDIQNGIVSFVPFTLAPFLTEEIETDKTAEDFASHLLQHFYELHSHVTQSTILPHQETLVYAFDNPMDGPTPRAREIGFKKATESFLKGIKRVGGVGGIFDENAKNAYGSPLLIVSPLEPSGGFSGARPA